MILLAFLWILYYVLHSVFASLSVKHWMKRNFTRFFPFYRLTYNAFSLISFMLILLHKRTIPDPLILTLPLWVGWIGVLFLVIGTSVLVVALKNYSFTEFAGFIPMTEFSPSKHELKVTGLNAWVRHPLYFATMLLLIGYLFISFTWNTLTFCCISFIYLLIGVALEEKKLVLMYGDQYRAYQKRVKKLLPFV